MRVRTAQPRILRAAHARSGRRLADGLPEPSARSRGSLSDAALSRMRSVPGAVDRVILAHREDGVGREAEDRVVDDQQRPRRARAVGRDRALDALAQLLGGLGREDALVDEHVPAVPGVRRVADAVAGAVDRVGLALVAEAACAAVADEGREGHDVLHRSEVRGAPRSADRVLAGTARDRADDAGIGREDRVVVAAAEVDAHHPEAEPPLGPELDAERVAAAAEADADRLDRAGQEAAEDLAVRQDGDRVRLRRDRHGDLVVGAVAGDREDAAARARLDLDGRGGRRRQAGGGERERQHSDPSLDCGVHGSSPCPGGAVRWLPGRGARQGPCGSPWLHRRDRSIKREFGDAESSRHHDRKFSCRDRWFTGGGSGSQRSTAVGHLREPGGFPARGSAGQLTGRPTRQSRCSTRSGQCDVIGVSWRNDVSAKPAGGMEGRMSVARSSRIRFWSIAGSALLALAAIESRASAKTPASVGNAAATPTREHAGAPSEDTWPHTVTGEGGSATVYQPQVISWPDQKTLDARAAIAIMPNGAKAPILGTIDVAFATETDLTGRTVILRDGRLISSRFPSVDTAQAAKLEERIRAAVAALPVKRVPLAMVTTSLAQQGEKRPEVAVDN